MSTSRSGLKLHLNLDIGINFGQKLQIFYFLKFQNFPNFSFSISLCFFEKLLLKIWFLWWNNQCWSILLMDLWARDDSSFRWHFQIGFPPTSVALWPPSQFFSFPAKTLSIRSKVDINLQQKSKMGSNVPYFSSRCGQVCKQCDVFW